MSKKRRTRKEKMSATDRQDFSKVLQLPQVEPIRITTTNLPKVNTSHTTTTYSLKSYAYVGKDIRQTLTITTILIAFNIVLFVVLKLQFVKLFGIVF